MNGTSVPDRNAGSAAGQEQVWGFGLETAIDSGIYMAPGAQRFFVDPNNTQATDAGNAGRDPTVPLATVEAAVALCRDYMGDTIFVGANDAWPYAAGLRATSINETLTVDKAGIRIVGCAPNPMAVTWEAESAADFCITVAAMDVLIEGFSFVGIAGGNNGIYAEWDGATLYGENLIVRNCIFDEDIDTAIQLEYTWFCQIYNNWFQECDVVGILADVAGSGIAYCDIHHNRFIDCALAISLLGGCDVNRVHHNSIFNSNAQGGAAAANEGINTTGGRENFVYQNIVSCLNPVPANGDWDDLCTAAATDAWVQNYLMDGPNTANPA